jgi:hypothetical protein
MSSDSVAEKLWKKLSGRAKILLRLLAAALAIFAVIKWHLWAWILLAIALAWFAVTTPAEHRINNKVTVWPIHRFTVEKLDVLESQEEKTYRVIPERQEVIVMGDLGLVRLEGCTVADRLNWQCPRQSNGFQRALIMLNGTLAESQSDDDSDAAFSLIATRFAYRVCPGEIRYVSFWRWLRVHTTPHVRLSPVDRAECSAPIGMPRTINGIDAQY